MAFCWRCGAEVEQAEARFCLACGANLQSQKKVPSPPVSQAEPALMEFESPEVKESVPTVPLTTYRLGKHFEENIASIFERMGYQVEMRHHFKEMGGAEIDLVLTRGNRKVAVECKNYDESRDVGIKEIRDFKGKLDQINIVTGIFVAATLFSDPAKEYAHSTGIQLWDKNEINERLFAYVTGRDSPTPVDTIDALRTTIDFLRASSLNLKNKPSIRIFSAALVYHPYHIVKFRVHGSRKDPAGKIHKINDEGTCVVDGIDGDIINRGSGFLEGVTSLFKGKEERTERKEDKLVYENLVSASPTKEYVKKNSDYAVSVVEPQVSPEEAKRSATEEAIRRNTNTVYYQPKSRSDDFFDTIDKRSMKIVPKRNEVSIRGQSMVYVPKWDLQYESGQRTYQRRMIASSGSVIEDDLAKCVKCNIRHHPTAAVCDVCGATLCEDHVYEEEGGLLCIDDVSDELRRAIKGKGITSRLFGKH
jgi:Holliday junction resolvase-like predicted endonuclease